MAIEEHVRISHAWGGSHQGRSEGRKGLGKRCILILTPCVQQAQIPCRTQNPFFSNPWLPFPCYGTHDYLPFGTSTRATVRQSITHEVRPGREGVQTDLSSLVWLEELLLLQVPRDGLDSPRHGATVVMRAGAGAHKPVGRWRGGGVRRSGRIVELSVSMLAEGVLFSLCRTRGGKLNHLVDSPTIMVLHVYGPSRSDSPSGRGPGRGV